jgi:hypothetical protein
MYDILFILIILLFYLISWGLLALCQRLMED